jgi:hypothetical protein
VYVVYETIILSVCLSEGRSQKASDDRAGGRAGPARAGAETDERPTDDDDANAGREYVTTRRRRKTDAETHREHSKED